MNKYILIAIIAAIIIAGAYVVNFHLILKNSISTDTAVWGQLGDYVGGLLNPILSFLTFIIVISSLNTQIDSNKILKDELAKTEKLEKLKSFESHFFNMINSQSVSFSSFQIDIVENDLVIKKKATDAVIVIEDEIEKQRSSHINDETIITEFLKELDEKDQLFNMSRRFYIIVKLVSEKLSDENGFNSTDRYSHFITLINFTEFSLLRLIMICTQFMDYHSSNYLKSNIEFKKALEEVGLNYQLY
ncbi:hypothetical protein [Dickeya dadantii]|uniref:hypothetical protein n=1 Tax=Dickeya dadantii TaxID=204038 RepID=UPI0014957553|nr:hypothetical protein [Dickeya dadantii]NPE51457.1 hypothetical protein [Dickeya dadantii]